MAGDYAALLNKYNRLFAQAQDLQQQLADKTDHARRQAEATGRTVAAAKNLCKEILAKDRKEMVLGRAYSWDGVDTDELLVKTLASFREYSMVMTDLLRRIKDESEDRRLHAEGLAAQNAELLFEISQGARRGAPSEGDADAARGADMPGPQEAPPEESAHPPAKIPPPDAAVPYKVRKAAESGAIDLIVEEDGDLADKDMDDIKEAMEMSKAVSLQAGDIPVRPSRKKAKQKADEGKKQMEAYVVNLASIKSQMTGYMWLIVDAIGAHGVSVYREIESKAFELWEGSEYQKEFDEGKRGKLTASRIRTAVQSLTNLGIIEDTRISDPLQSHYLVCYLTPMGSQAYGDRYGKRPVLSEHDRLLADHDNAEHGYGIKSIAEMFRASGFFSSVTNTRNENRVKVDENLWYEADVVTVGSRFTSYYEYERGYHNQANFNIKLNKMSKITGVMSILVPAKDTLATIQGQVEKWIESRGGHKALFSKRVRIATVRSLVGKDPHRHENWGIVYDMKSDRPVINAPAGEQPPPRGTKERQA